MDTSSNLDMLDYLTNMEGRLLSQMNILSGKILDIRELIITTSEKVKLLHQQINQISNIISHL